jgi:pimeloyl-ACP methyl ester carboxylesterase
MQQANVNGTTLAFETHGDGEPVVLLHCGFVGNAFAPLLGEPALAGRYRLVAYQRRGYGESGPAQPPLTIGDHAADCLALMDHLGIAHVHIVGHSFGANVALEIARVASERAHTLVLLEPPLPWAMNPDALQVMLGVIGAAVGKFMAGDAAAAVDEWLDGAFGPGWQAVVESAVPGGVAQVYKDGPAALGVEGPALESWDFGPDDLKRIEQPTLAAYHVDTRFTIFDEVQQTLVRVLPNVESLVIPNATHLMQIQNPRSVGEGLARFFARHAMAAAMSAH